MKVGVFVLAVFLSHSGVAAEVYKCVDDKGRKMFSDKPCPKITMQETLKYKETSLDDQLIGAVPGKSKVVSIRKEGEDRLIDYRFSSNDELQEFMRLSQRLSSKNVNLLKINMPHNGAMGTAVIQITPEEGLFKANPKATN